ncbi:MAG: hypothetical protein M0R32_08145 [Candidatus Cloacimonetes bacterium]|jgi:hypothetical protein|nr:hypothetical protein [Candidatus Cloacimonadota bacterium]
MTKVKKTKTIKRETAVKKDKAGKIGKEPKAKKDKVADDIRGSLKTEKVKVKLRSPVSKGLLSLAQSITEQAKPGSRLMKSLKSLEDGAIKVEQISQPASKIARKAIEDLADFEIAPSYIALKKTLAEAKRELSNSVKAHLDEIEKRIRKTNPSEFDDIKERIEKLLQRK